MSEIRDKIAVMVGGLCEPADRMCDEQCEKCEDAIKITTQILAIEELAVVDREAELPGFIDKTANNQSGGYTAGLIDAINRMLRAGYVKEVKD